MKIIYRRHRKSKSIRITIRRADDILVTYPWWVSQNKARQFAISKENWIKKKLEKLGNRKEGLLIGGDKKDYLKNKEKARRLIYKKIQQFNQFYGFKYKKIAVRNQKTRWGSCSRNSNLNFSYRIVYLPEKLVDYLVVHELCHLKELNHSMKFWNLVSETIPDYRNLAKKLRKL